MGRAAKTTITGAAIAAMLAVGVPAVKQYEGLSTTPYRDVIGKLTVCYGETAVPMRRYTVKECGDMLQGRFWEFGYAVIQRNPSLGFHPYQWAAATSLAYNIGIANYNRSTVAKNFDAGKWTVACRGFSVWKYAGGKVSQGLINRRADETRLCLTQLPAGM